MEKVSKYFGVNWLKSKNCWCARVSFKGKRSFIGYFNSDEEAFKSINVKKKELNIPEQNLDELLLLEGEVFKKIDSFPDLEVSNFGRVVSFFRGRKKLLKHSVSVHGYSLVKVVDCKGVCRSRTVHLLVAQAFLNHISDGTHKLVADHIDSDKKNNSASNLQIISQRENNSKKNNNNKKSKKIGVYLTKFNKFNSSIYYNGKSIHLGTFDTEEEASEYYQNALKSIENEEEIVLKRLTHTSKYKGVSWNKKMSKWVASIFINNKPKHLGYYNYEEEAYKIYEEAKKEYTSKLNSKQ